MFLFPTLKWFSKAWEIKKWHNLSFVIFPILTPAILLSGGCLEDLSCLWHQQVSMIHCDDRVVSRDAIKKQRKKYGPYWNNELNELGVGMNIRGGFWKATEFCLIKVYLECDVVKPRCKL